MMYNNYILSIHFQVNTNGALSFQQEFPIVPSINQLLFNTIDFDSPLVLPFWVDVDITIAGTIFYRETANTTLIQQFQNDILKDVEFFHPTTLFIATWNNVAQFGGIPTVGVVGRPLCI